MKTFILCLLLAGSAAAQTNVAVFAAPGVQHAPSAKRVSLALTSAVAELKLDERDLPPVAIFYIDREAAKIMQINPRNEITIVSATNHNEALRTVYQAWVVDGANDTVTALAMIEVLNARYKLNLTSTQLVVAARGVLSRLQQQIDIASLR